MIAALVLAAGSSTRLGRPKQLEPWGNGTLLEATLDLARSLEDVDSVWAVLGSRIDDVLEGVSFEGVQIVENPEWEEGIASSLRVGLDALQRLTETEAALVMLGDQPSVSPQVVSQLVERWTTTRTMSVVPKYRYSWGNPILLSRDLWPRLMSLEGDEGARRFLQAHPEWVEEVWVESMPPRDVDTQSDVEELRPRHP